MYTRCVARSSLIFSGRNKVSRYILDTNLYIRATRDNEQNRALAAFLLAFTPQIYLHSVVAFELLAGATNPALQKRTHEAFIEPFERRSRIITPSHEAWKRAANVLAQLVGQKRVSLNGITRSLVNDCVIAASTRESGCVIITENRRDFGMINTVLPIEIAEPWPIA